MSDTREQELINDLDRARAAKNEKLTAANIAAFNAAQKALDDYRASKSGAEVDSFATKRDVISYLIKEGYDVKPDSSKVNGDLDGVPRKEGKWTKRLIDEYAENRLWKADGTHDIQNNDLKRKLKADADSAEEDAKKKKMQNDIMRGQYLLRTDVEQQFAARAAFLKNGVGAGFIHSRAARIIELVGGDMNRVPDLVEMWLAEVEGLFDHYARPVEFMAPGSLGGEEEEE